MRTGLTSVNICLRGANKWTIITIRLVSVIPKLKGHQWSPEFSQFNIAALHSSQQFKKQKQIKMQQKCKKKGAVTNVVSNSRKLTRKFLTRGRSNQISELLQCTQKQIKGLTFQANTCQC